MITQLMMNEAERVSKQIRREHPWTDAYDVESIVYLSMVILTREKRYTWSRLLSRSMDALRKESQVEHGINIPRTVWRLVRMLHLQGYTDAVPPLDICRAVFRDPEFSEIQRTRLVMAVMARKSMYSMGVDEGE